MPGSSILEVVVGVVFVYLLLSLICSALNEWIAASRNLRARTLEEGIRNLLNDPGGAGLAGKIYNHPLIRGLARRESLPSYIPSRTFAITLLDVIAPADPRTGPKSLMAIREEVGRLGDNDLKKALLLLIDSAEGDLKRARQNVERWFDDAMDRVSGWYKRNTQWIVLGLALGVSVALNADSILIAGSLWRDSTVRASLVAAAQEFAKQPASPGSESLARIKQVQDEIGRLQLPMGWSLTPGDPRVPSTWWGWAIKVIGLLFTTIAVSLGAPFWFDILNKLVNLRSAGKQPEKTPAEKSEEKLQ